MLYFFSNMYYVVVSITTFIIGYIIYKGIKVFIGKDKSHPRSGSLCLYWPKWMWHCVCTKIDQRLRPRRLNNYDIGGLQYETCGIVPTKSEVELESPKNLITDRHEDGMFFWGGDIEGRLLVAKVVRLSRRRACVMLLIRDSDGTLYTLPNQPDSNVQNVSNEGKWIGNGLFLECVEPMRLWRVKFNGFLRRGIRSDYITDDINDDDDDQDTPIFHARVDFLWRAMRAPVDVWADSNCGLLAHALARESGLDSSLFRALERDGYDQWGALHGTIQLGDLKEQNWYLRGGRQHRWGMSDSATNLVQSVNLFSYMETGDISWTETFSYDSGISRCSMGYMQTACGHYVPISQTSLDLLKLSESNQVDEIKNIFVDFRAGRTNHTHWHHFLDQGCKIYTGDPWTLRHDIKPTYVASKNNQGWGLALFTTRFPGLCPVPEKENIPVLFPSIPSHGQEHLVLQFPSTYCRHSPLTGGKGASLAFLVAMKPHDPDLEFSVPPGVVVTSAAWTNQLNCSAELRAAILNLEKAVTASQKTLIKEACEKILKLMDCLSVSDTVIDSLRKELGQVFKGQTLDDIRLAVRSSACGEDSEDASSAGQNETFLGCFWEARVENCEGNNSEDFKKSSQKSKVSDALMACWASQFSYQSVEYRRQRGQALNDGMGVVIQQMVPAEVAGVSFTRDPVTGDPGVVTISANYGLGESVVSGACEPDTVIIQRTWRRKFKVKSRIIGEKNTKFTMKDDGGTREEDVDPDSSASLCISDDLALKLAKISTFIEIASGSPRDIEFAVAQNKIYILQSRPITTLFEWTDYEIIHELDSAFISDKEIHTVANTGEVFPGYSTPLTLTTIVKLLDMAVQRLFCQREYPFYKYNPSVCRNIVSTFSRTIINVGEVFYRGIDDEISLANYALDLSVFGHVITTKQIHQWAKRRFGAMGFFPKMIRLGYGVYDILMNPKRVKSHKSHFSNYSIDHQRARFAKSLYNNISNRIPELLQICETHGATSGASTMTQLIAMMTLAGDKSEMSAQMVEDVAHLFSSISQTESGDVPSEIKRLAYVIASSPEAKDFLSMSADEAAVWLETDPESVGKRYRAFIDKHGHRCIKEFDFRSLSWGMCPDSLVNALQQMVLNPSSFEAKKEKEGTNQILETLQTPINSTAKRVLRVVLGICGKSVNLRESTKSMLIKTVDGFRRAYRSLGQLMVSECRLPEADLIFFLHHREIEILLDTRSPLIISKALKRRRLMKQLDDYVFDEIMFGVPSPVNLESRAGDGMGENVNTLRGTPVCHGVVMGTARIVTKLENAHEIQNGDILVTYSTDVGWSPYFPLLSGVITEIGGLISHGAVVAREYGLPCVVGVKHATRILKSGEGIRLNGGQGYVERIEEEEDIMKRIE